MPAASTQRTLRAMTSIGQAVVCGVDHSPEGVVAARVAARLADPGGSLTLVSVEDTTGVVETGWAAPTLLRLREEEARSALAGGQRATSALHGADARLLEGNPSTALLSEARERRATLVVVGSHGHSRPVGIVRGSVTTFVLHEARCSVLVARAADDFDRWPRAILVGVDGSPQSAAAVAAARSLAQRFGATLRAVLATSDWHVDAGAARRVAPELEEREGTAVDVLVAGAERADLVVVGNRGLHGVRALGSVGERVGHHAPSSVLVVRRLPHPP